ncbi:MAG TPA: S8 family serine peptidase [Polyangiaceae bacterium]|nr:S8 family serine peptidase [Polyangiaceae bacterium]
MFGALLVGCSGETEVKPGRSGEFAPSEAASEGARASDTPPTAPISSERVVVTLGAVPGELEGVPLGDAAWVRWLQGVLGSSVEVSSVSLLHRGSDTGDLDYPAPGSLLVVTLRAADAARVRAAVTQVTASSSVLKAEADPVWTSHATPNDPRYPEQQHLPQILANQAWDTTTGSPSVVVAVLDSGLNISHPDLAAAVWTNDDAPDGIDNDANGFVDDVHGWNFVNGNSDLTDAPGHGTHVAGLIGATGNNGQGVIGVAPGVRLMPVKVGGPAIAASAVAQAIYYAVDNGADIINMSFGGPETFSGARAAVDYAVAHGVLLVGSAGNSAFDEYNYPAVYQDILAVAALGAGDGRAALSNYGRWVDVAAPGLSLLSTFLGSDYVQGSGTSQAAPLVSGVLALVLSAHPTWSAEQARAQLLATARDVTSANPEYVGLLGAGIVNAAAAVGPQITAPRAYLAGVQLAEATGNGDQEVDAGETAKLSASLHFTSGSGAKTAQLTSSDPWITVTSGSSALNTAVDRASTATFQVAVAPNVPADHVAQLRVQVAGTSIDLPLQIAVARSVHHIRLPFAFEQRLLQLPGGGEVLISDDASRGGTQTTGGAPDFVYATFRNPDGSFSARTVLSADTANNARRPRAVVAPNGDIHVAFFQSVQNLEFAAFPAYARYDAASGVWQASTLITSGPGVTAGNEGCVDIARDANGTLHLAWANNSGVVTLENIGGTWGTPVQHVISLPSGLPQARLTFLRTSAGLDLFAHPVTASLGSPSTYTAPTTVLHFAPTTNTWSAPAVVSSVVTDEIGQDPYVFGDSIWRHYQAPGSTLASLAEFDGTAWTLAGIVFDLDGADFRRSFLAVQQGVDQYLTYLARPAAGTNGTTRELIVEGTSRALPGDAKLRAVFPTLALDSAGEVHSFNQEKKVRRLSEGVYWETGASTSYYTAAELASGARPTVPVVGDAGASTSNGTQIVASWSSTHVTGIASYRVAIGSVPGGEDLVPWQTTTATQATFSLGDQRLLPGQTVYVSVEARANGLLTSGIGVSDGITYQPVAPSCVPTGCEAAATVSLPYSVNGPVNGCVFFSGATSFINSWNMNLVELNGTAATNQWKASGSFPATCNGGHYLRMSGPFSWSHVEVQ